jgi:acyl-CoA synthetase (AMP-forming)/AMP-acid ligase II
VGAASFFLLSPARAYILILGRAGYGLTETSPTTHLLTVGEADRKMGSIGILLPNLEARLVEDDAGEVDAEEGKPGELWVRGRTVMKVGCSSIRRVHFFRSSVCFLWRTDRDAQGYLNNPAATANAITPDGWFKTGDVAIRDAEGYYYIVGAFRLPSSSLSPWVADAGGCVADRRKELIKYKVCVFFWLLTGWVF